ncbi:hypothetical protein KGF56_001451 [Candida oxycetoniae]|uniref:Exosome complex protein n=1 Tax=Candida oxycetoniae TaxID=497107 RepID=A0AAI9WZA3_9ASCO|nr:uncharacterized protein KGF56_001451 [Candida oxycetoniae]KAI3405844.2 hypothetical protein KGF56_001451 [Candida oxycetoniae]
MENIENVKLFLKSLDSSLAQYEHALQPLLSRTIDEHLALKSTNIDKIQFLNNFQYVLISTIFSYLKAIGVDTDQHPIKKELVRIKSYMLRAKALDKRASGGQQNKSKQEEEEKNRENKEYLTRTLGIKSGVVGMVKDTSPAISTQSFQGIHKRFKDDDEEEESDDGLEKQQEESPTRENDVKGKKKAKDRKDVGTTTNSENTVLSVSSSARKKKHDKAKTKTKTKTKTKKSGKVTKSL